MKFTVSLFEKRNEDKQRRWSHLFGGRVRTSTLVLIVAFLAMWWVYDTYRPEPPKPPPPPQVVPPGFLPDPNYTWVPRTRVDAPRPATPTFVPTPTTTVPPSPTTTVPPPPTTTTPPPPFQLPCLLPPPFCPPSSSSTPPPPQQPVPGPGPAPSTPPPAS
ncbi:hypothetical protein [Mycobacterium sherrisii]|uniref:hypothetical protein n=1 Tax=Mycobacterium sherrisii TaxID=243061 RepID=UPI000A169F01|nr:hypothetical protein [Mycobacterium sherrisii]